MATDNVLEIKNLHTYFYTDGGVIKAVDGVDVELRRGATLGIVGESGSGKSVTSLSVMGLLTGTKGKIADGEINDSKIHHENSSRSACENPEWRDLF